MIPLFKKQVSTEYSLAIANRNGLRDTYKEKMFETEIRRSVVAEKAETAKRPLPEMSRGSNAAKDYNNVLKEIMTEEEWNEAQAYIESKRRNKKTGRFQRVD